MIKMIFNTKIFGRKTDNPTASNEPRYSSSKIRAYTTCCAPTWGSGAEGWKFGEFWTSELHFFFFRGGASAMWVFCQNQTLTAFAGNTTSFLPGLRLVLIFRQRTLLIIYTVVFLGFLFHRCLSNSQKCLQHSYSIRKRSPGYENPLLVAPQYLSTH